MNSIIIGQVWQARTTPWQVTVTRITGNVVHYAWIEVHPDAETITNSLNRATFLEAFRPV